MEDLFEKLMAFFDSPAKNKEQKMQEFFAQSRLFFDDFNKTLAEGTPEEKVEVLNKMKILREKISLENKTLRESAGLTKEEVKDLAGNSGNFNPEEWKIIEEMKKKIDFVEKKIKHKASKDSKLGRKSIKKSNWIRS